MSTIYYDLYIDILNRSYNVVEIPQGDNNTRILKIYVLNNGSPYPLATANRTYVCSGTNGAGGNVQRNVGVSQSGGKTYFELTLSDNFTSAAGIGRYRIDEYNVSQPDVIQATFNFYLSIQKSALDIGDVVASDEFQTLADILSRADQQFNRWLIGNGVPGNSLGDNNDLYLNTANSAVYQKISGSWVFEAMLGSQMYIAYATDEHGSNFSPTYDGTQSYFGICSSQSETQPTDPTLYNWFYVTGDLGMTVEAYGGSDENTVAQADMIKGEFVIDGITIPSNTTTATTTITITNEAIGASSILEGVYTTKFGYNPINIIMRNGSMDLTFPASATATDCIVKIKNQNNLIYPFPSNYNDMIMTPEDVNIDFSDFLSV